MEALEVAKKAGVNDGCDGALDILRDASAVRGGIPGHVNATDFTSTITTTLAHEVDVRTSGPDDGRRFGACLYIALGDGPKRHPRGIRD